jgi:2-(1,2-epoxy-1,2-dihydrophenyl)acetyl-CoA isomerase
MTSSEYLLCRDHGAVRVLTLNRPAKKNSINLQLAGEITGALQEADQDDQVRVVVVDSTGDVFCAGVDLTVFLGVTSYDAPELESLSYLDRALRSFSKPLIAAVQGPAVGMGVTLLPYFDLVYASTRASFTTPFVSLGLVLEYGSSFTLPRLIGRQRTNEMVLRSQPIDAETAAQWGLVTRLFTDEELSERVLEIARDIAAQPPSAVATCKRLIAAGEDSSLDEADQRERETLAGCYGSEENLAAVRAFLESR